MKKWEGEVGRIRERTSEGDSGVDSGGQGQGQDREWVLSVEIFVQIMSIIQVMTYYRKKRKHAVFST